VKPVAANDGLNKLPLRLVQASATGISQSIMTKFPRSNVFD
jgi:hypothetical protein